MSLKWTLRACALATGLVLSAAAPAWSATVSVTVDDRFATLHFAAARGEDNKVAITYRASGPAGWDILDNAVDKGADQNLGIAPGPGCSAGPPPSDVRCDVPEGLVPIGDIRLGDRGDYVTLDGKPFATTLYGGAGRDRLEGGGDADVIRGGTGRDDITGRAGADRVLVRDGEADEVKCDSEDDRVVADRRDFVAGRRCQVKRPVPGGGLLLSAGQNEDEDADVGFQLYVFIGCSVDSTDACRGTVAIGVRGGRELRRASFRVPPGRERFISREIVSERAKNQLFRHGGYARVVFLEPAGRRRVAFRLIHVDRLPSPV